MESRKKKLIKYSVSTLIALLLIYNSIYLEDLDQRQHIQNSKNFDPVRYVQEFWNDKLPSILQNSIQVEKLLNGLKTNIVETGDNYGRTLGLASTYYFLIQGKGQIIELTDEGILVSITENRNIADLLIATNYIFGNAIRDASGLVDVNDFPSSMEFNNISSEINKVVTTRIIPSFVEKVNVGDNLVFFCASEINKDNPEISPLRLIPIQVKIDE
jgi:predicted lipoprotein